MKLKIITSFIIITQILLIIMGIMMLLKNPTEYMKCFWSIIIIINGICIIININTIKDLR